MNSKVRFVLALGVASFLSCQSNDASNQSGNSWTENQEIHFYNDCKDKMISQGESDENAHAFCECCLLKLKDLYPNGKEAMENLTDSEIERIEGECFSQDSSM